MNCRTGTRHNCSVSLRRLLVPALPALLALAACHPKTPPPTPPAEVQAVVVHPQTLPLTRDFVGRLSSVRMSDVRARVAGVLLKRLYREGSDVTQGQALFQIDPAPLEATLHRALGALAAAQASATNAQVLAQRDRELTPKGWISRSDLDTAEANERTTAAQVKQAQADVETARINLGYARVTAPIAGRAGQQQVTEGALVGQGEATLLTTIEQTDPLYINFDQPAEEILKLHGAVSRGEITPADAKARLDLSLADGTPYELPGWVDFSDITVDPSTGALALRGQVANPNRRLLPGMFVNVRLTLGELKSAFLVPAPALQRDDHGAYVLIADRDNKVAERRVHADTLRGGNWVITQGLADADRIIVSRLQQVHPGSPVKVLGAEAALQASR